MAASRDALSRWFDEGVKRGATHMIVVCDTFDYEDFPVYVMPGENARQRVGIEGMKEMQRVMECYLLSVADKADQMAERRAMHLD